MSMQEFINQRIGCDIYSTKGGIGMRITAPVELTEEGKEYFKDALALKIRKTSDGVAIVTTRSLKSEMQVIELLGTIAGYFNQVCRNRWFKEIR